MKEVKKTDINEIIRLAFLKYKLSNKRNMNTFIFTQAKNNKLTDEEIDEIINTLNQKIEHYETKKRQKEDEKSERELRKILKII